MVKCEICNEREAEVIAANPLDGPFRFECVDCESNHFYWISMEQLRAQPREWYQHLLDKRWFDWKQFLDKLAEAGITSVETRKNRRYK